MIARIGPSKPESPGADIIFFRNGNNSSFIGFNFLVVIGQGVVLPVGVAVTVLVAEGGACVVVGEAVGVAVEVSVIVGVIVSVAVGVGVEDGG